MTGLNDAFIINEETRQNILDNCKTKDERERTDQIIRPILRGRDIRKNGYEWAGLYLICTHNGYEAANNKYISPISVDEYYNLKEWFDNGYWNKKSITESNYDRLAKRSDKGITPYNLRDCAYMDDFNKQKIMYSEIVRKPQFYLDNENFVPEATTFILTGEHIDSLVQYLNSSIVAWIFKTYYAGGGLGSEGFRYKKQFLINLPIPRKFDELLSDDKIMSNYGFSESEMNFISSEVNSKIE